jgi:hypothetical protein
LRPNLFELRHYLVREQADVFHRHLLRHAAEVEGAGNRRQPGFLAPFANAIGNALGIPGKNKSLLQLRLGVAVLAQRDGRRGSLMCSVGIYSSSTGRPRKEMR